MKCAKVCAVFSVLMVFQFSRANVVSSNINSMLVIRNMMPRTAKINPELLETVAYGVQAAMDFCKEVFKWDRWNCPESAFSIRYRPKAVKEQAVVHAMVSAALVHSVTRNCSRGSLQGCRCNPTFNGRIHNSAYISSRGLKLPPNEKSVDWVWGGCSDDVEFGQSISKMILDDLERGNDPQAFTNLQNNLVGRAMVRSTMVKRCRCHGVSGSCSLQTCWMQVAPFAKIATTLRERYRKARKINMDNRNNRFIVDQSSSDQIPQSLRRLGSHQLVFLDYSPDYCITNITAGWPGTKGRMCSRTHSKSSTLAEKRSCKNLCRKCGLKVRKQMMQIAYKCNCVFKWCCEVQCDTCVNTVDEFFCD